MSTTTAPATLGHWIGGRADAADADRHGEVTESATGEVVARVPFATRDVVDRAVRAAIYLTSSRVRHAAIRTRAVRTNSLPLPIALR